jgi:YfiH family protein
MAERIEATALRHLPGIAHGFFTRRGGVSEGVYGSLNCGQGSADTPAKVNENRGRIARSLGAEPSLLVSSWQVHGASTAVVEAPWKGDRPQADALVTTTRGLTLGVLTADCAPILLADAEAGVIGAAHAGWRGALGGVIESVVDAMEQLGGRRERIAAAVGPAIGPDSYEVGPEFKREVLVGAPENGRFFHHVASGRAHFDLAGFCLSRLSSAGVGTIEHASPDTYADESRFFSFRRTTHRQEPDYGRQISAIVLK